jgi:hypothetical protein
MREEGIRGIGEKRRREKERKKERKKEREIRVLVTLPSKVHNS